MIADWPDAAWIGAALLAALEESTAARERPADPAKPFNKARAKAFGVRSQMLRIRSFAESGEPGEATDLELPVSAEELGQGVRAAEASVR